MQILLDQHLDDSSQCRRLYFKHWLYISALERASFNGLLKESLFLNSP